MALPIIFLIVGEALALLWLFYGMWRLHRTLNPKQETKQQNSCRSRDKPSARAVS